MHSPHLSWQQQAHISVLQPGNYGILTAQSGRRVAGCIAILIVLLGLVSSVHPIHALLTGVASMTAEFSAKAPEFTFRDGELIVEAKMPLYYRGDRDTLIVIDTTDTADLTILDDLDRGILLTRYALYEKKCNILAI